MTSKFLSLLVSAAAVTSISSAALKSPFESLPAETVAAVRFDNSPETLEHYTKNTKIGQLLLSDEKIAEYKAFIEKLIESEDADGNFLQTLGEVGLELDDLYEMLTSHLGGALVDQEVPGHLSMPTVLLWAEMSDGVAERAYNAVLEGSTENDTIERTDLDLPGGPGARIRNVMDGSSFLIAQLENRFIFAIGNVREPITDMDAAKVFEEAELEALGRFMSAQIGSGGDFLTTFYSGSGIGEARPDYYCRLEALGKVQDLLDLVPPESLQGLQAIDLDKFTKVGIWSGLVEMQERSMFYLGAPAPRVGIAKLFENEYFDFQPPEWVPASVNTYTAASFDMTKLYDFFVEVGKKFAPPEQVEQQIAMGNAQLQAMLQTDIPTLLSSFGKRIHVIEYPIEIESVTQADGTSVDVPRSSQAIVMDFSRPEILQAGMAMLSGVAQNPNGGFEIIEEQGFSGVRMNNPSQGTVTIGHGLGKLVIAIGSTSTSSRIFSTLSSLPEGEDALVNSSDFRSYVSENNIKPAMMFSYSQGDQILKNLIPVLETLSDTLRGSVNEEAAELMDELTELMPTEEELDGLLGVTFSRMYYTDSGLILEGANQYK